MSDDVWDNVLPFLRTRYDERERAVAAILRRMPHWKVDPEPWETNGVGVIDDQGAVAVAVGSYAADHIALNDPAYVLADIESKRRILADHTWSVDEEGYSSDCAGCRQAPPCRTVRMLALPFATHPDYRQEWRP